MMKSDAAVVGGVWVRVWARVRARVRLRMIITVRVMITSTLTWVKAEAHECETELGSIVGDSDITCHCKAAACTYRWAVDACHNWHLQCAEAEEG